MYRTILRYDTIHTIRTLYRTIHEHLRYANMIRNFLHIIQYVSYETYRTIRITYRTILTTMLYSSMLNIMALCNFNTQKLKYVNLKLLKLFYELGEV